ncbi:MAG: TetR/AcrR family transcriptional regulator [Povalibacter sp.]
MSSPPYDRRTVRTRSLLENAFHRLLQTADYESITVEDICAHSKVGRSTFYNHFRNKDDLKRGALDHLRADLLEFQRQASAGAELDQGFFAFAVPLFEHAREHVTDYRVLKHGRGGRVALSRIREIVWELVANELAAESPADGGATINQYRIAFITGACMALLTRWLADGARTPSAEMSALFRQMARAALR